MSCPDFFLGERRRKFSLDFSVPIEDNDLFNFVAEHDPLLSLESERRLYEEEADCPNFDFGEDFVENSRESSVCLEKREVPVTQLFEGKRIEGSFCSVNDWKTEYQRKYRKCGGKNLRCFPYCNPIHLNTTFCGDSLKFSLKSINDKVGGFLDTLGPQMNDERKRFCVFAEFSPASKPPAFTPGSAFLDRNVLENKITDSNVQTLWWPGLKTFPGEDKKHRTKGVKPHSQFSVLSERELESGVVIEFNRERRAWHYGFVVSKATKRDKHCVNVYVFSFQETTSISKEFKSVQDMTSLKELKCIAWFKSPEFELYGKKKHNSESKRLICRRNSTETTVEYPESFGDLEQFPGSITRKRSFIDSFDDVAELIDDTKSVASSTLKRHRSLRELSALDTFLEGFEEDSTAFSKSVIEMPNEKLFTRAKSFSVPPTKSNRTLAIAPSAGTPSIFEDRPISVEAKLLYFLLKDVAEMKEDKFVSVLSRFLLSSQETLTGVIQTCMRDIVRVAFAARAPLSETVDKNLASGVLFTSFKFLEKNFPPFKKYCAKIKETEEFQAFQEKDFNKILVTFVRRHVGAVPTDPPAFVHTISPEMSAFMNDFGGSWKINCDDKQLCSFFALFGHKNLVQRCLIEMESTLLINIEPQTSTLLLKTKEKLFSNGMQRLIFDGKIREWGLANPLLVESFKVTQYKAIISLPERKILIEYFVPGETMRATRTFRISKDGLHSCFSLYKPSVAPFVSNEPNWALVHAAEVSFSRN